MFAQAAQLLPLLRCWCAARFPIERLAIELVGALQILIDRVRIQQWRSLQCVADGGEHYCAAQGCVQPWDPDTNQECCAQLVGFSYLLGCSPSADFGCCKPSDMAGASPPGESTVQETNTSGAAFVSFAGVAATASFVLAVATL